MKKLNKSNKLNLNSIQTLSDNELTSFRGGLGGWDGRCGIKYNGVWSCGTGEGYTYDDVTWHYYNEPEVNTAWCCASCADESKCGPSVQGPV